MSALDECLDYADCDRPVTADVAAARAELATLRADLTRERERAARLERRVSDLKFALGDNAGWFDRAKAAERERDEARERAERAEAAMADVIETIKALELTAPGDRSPSDRIDQLAMDLTASMREQRNQLDNAKATLRAIRAAGNHPCTAVDDRFGIRCSEPYGHLGACQFANPEAEAKAATLDRLTAPGPVLLSDQAIDDVHAVVRTLCANDGDERHIIDRTAHEVARAQFARCRAALEAVPVEALALIIQRGRSNHDTGGAIATRVRARLLQALTEATDPQAGGAPAADAGEKETE